jgi:ribosomal protein S18 acetylase RimI-like enzyme
MQLHICSCRKPSLTTDKKSMNNTIEIAFRAAEQADAETLGSMLPQLADFDIPSNRKSEQLWQSDLELLNAILAGKKSDSFIKVAVTTTQPEQILGLAMITLRDELFSHEPSAHLEALIVNADARGLGLGRKLLAHAEECVREHGARSLTLHVFSNNHRARSLYDNFDFDSELIRAVKWL